MSAHGPAREGARHAEENQGSRSPWAFERGRLWVMDLASRGDSPVLSQPVLPAEFREVGRASAGTLALAMDLPGPDPILRRFAAGRRCSAAWLGDQIAAYCWISQAPECIGELEREIQIPSDEAYIWDCATLPPFRRKNLYNALLGQLSLQLKAEGLRRIWIGSSLDNHPSQRAFQRAGFLPVANALYLRLYNLSCMMVSGTPNASGDLVALARRRLASSHERSWGPFLLSSSEPATLPACAQP